MEPTRHKLVPQQTEGIQKDLKEELLAQDVDEAQEIFVIAKERLLNVNNWNKICDTLTSDFKLTDGEGNEVDRNAHYNDYIRIDIPGPGSQAGDGYDWVLIEAIEYDDFPDEDYETIAMRVRPSTNPKNDKDEIAHFFDNNATSTFVIERRGRHITVHYHGRNELTNTDNGAIDNIRNLAIAAGAWLFGSEGQWQGLIKGLITDISG